MVVLLLSNMVLRLARWRNPFGVPLEPAAPDVAAAEDIWVTKTGISRLFSSNFGPRSDERLMNRRFGRRSGRPR
jgi:hypothetical protein